MTQYLYFEDYIAEHKKIIGFEYLPSADNVTRKLELEKKFVQKLQQDSEDENKNEMTVEDRSGRIQAVLMKPFLRV